MLLIQGAEIRDGLGGHWPKADLLIDKTILKISESLEREAGVDCLDGRGLLLLPGFIDPLNKWGCVGPGWRDSDLDEYSHPVTPEMDVSYAFDADSMMFQRLFEYGLTSCGVAPGLGNVIGGGIGFYSTYGDHPMKMLLANPVAMQASVSHKSKQQYGSDQKTPMTRMAVLALLRESFHKTAAYMRKKERGEEQERNLRWEALAPVLRREIPLVVHCGKRFEMAAALRLRDEFSLRLILSGAWEISDTLTEDWRDVDVVLGDLTELMGNMHDDFDLAAVRRLMAKGVRFAISSTAEYTASGKESLLWNALLYQRKGFTSEEILAMISANTARIFSLENLLGAVAEGRRADFSLWTGDPFSSSRARLRHCFVGGQSVLDKRRASSCW